MSNEAWAELVRERDRLRALAADEAAMIRRLLVILKRNTIALGDQGRGDPPKRI